MIFGDVAPVAVVELWLEHQKSSGQAYTSRTAFKEAKSQFLQ